MTPRRRDSFVPATPSFPSRTLEELSELKSTFQVPGIAGCVASETTEIQGQHQGFHIRRRGSRTVSRTCYANLDSLFDENALVFVVPKTGGALVTLLRPPW